MLENIKKLNPNANINNGCAVAVGGFDGVHIGHRALLSMLTDISKKLSVPSAVFTFLPEDSPKKRPLLAQPQKKLDLLQKSGVNFVFSAPFSKIKSISASDFVKDVLLSQFGCKAVVCGYDFRFGKDRLGNVDFIKETLEPLGVKIITPAPVTENGVAVSSTYIRSLVSNGDIKTANRLLGDRFSFKSEVVNGRKLGRTLGFPTINQVYPQSLTVPKHGVYAVECKINGRLYGGVANIGFKPTVGGVDAPLCETHIFEYNGDCYFQEVETFFVDFIREEKRFPTLDALKTAVENDKTAAMNILLKGV